jgi:hypothetical protein
MDGIRSQEFEDLDPFLSPFLESMVNDKYACLHYFASVATPASHPASRCMVRNCTVHCMEEWHIYGCRQESSAPEFACLESKNCREVDVLKLQDICRGACKFGGPRQLLAFVVLQSFGDT